MLHTRDHIAGVQRRASQIFQVLCPDLPPTEDIERLEQLLDLCAATHNLIQIFVPQLDPHTPRRRAAGVSEAATIERAKILTIEFDTASNIGKVL